MTAVFPNAFAASALTLREALARTWETNPRLAIARRWVNTRLMRVAMLRQMILSGDRSTMEDFAVLAGPVPVV